MTLEEASADTPDTAARRPLADLVVLDLTSALAGPYATLLLAGLGARVIKVEHPRGGDTSRHNAPYLGRDGASLVRQHPDDVSLGLLNRSRNKEAVALDLKHPEGRDVFLRLATRADVVVENFSRGTATRLGVGYEAVRAVNPGIVYCSISGFGAEGEPGTGKAMDTMIQALSGMMRTCGEENTGPVRNGVPFGDLTAPLAAVIGILAAVHQRASTGTGQLVDVSMLGALTSLVAHEPWGVLERVGIPVRTGSTVPRLAPFGVFATRDGDIALCAPTDAFARAVLRAIGRPELVDDPRFAARDSRVAHAEELHGLIADWAGRQSTCEAIAALEAQDVPVAEVREAADAVRDAALLERGETVRLAHPRYGVVDDDAYGSGMPFVMSDADLTLDRPPPELGEHTAAVLRELAGLDEAALEHLATEGVI